MTKTETIGAMTEKNVKRKFSSHYLERNSAEHVEEEEEEKIPAIIVYCIMKLWLMKQWSPSSLNIILNPKQEGYIRKPPEYFWK